MVKEAVSVDRQLYIPVGNIVELIGPPGIGKSALYDAACNKWDKTQAWTHEEILWTPSRPSILDFTEWLSYIYRKVTGKKFYKSYPLTYGMDFAFQHPRLSNFIWKHMESLYPTENQVAYRYRAAYFLFLTFSRYQAIIKEKSYLPILLEEGFLQKSFLVNADGKLMSKILDEYLPLIPMPTAVVCMKAPSNDLILKRIRSRGKTIASHKGKTDLEILQDIQNWERMNRLICKKLSKVGVRVKYLDASKPLEENVTELSQILTELN